ncbi:hypothetical protein BXZ70DRAFT_937484 [Cristinia sonorae]|uniref:Uncharacterized protein n=1 Tax=Cristinia sonorae TaxID=1940300 RepID=A0A8K0XPW9_9AGAR|nr:hypothetical protein BXZ70DRAFT_937484 [Cristinia sonorae]
MKEKGIGTPWSTEEDNLLRQAVAVHGECDNWKQVAVSVPGRTNKACRKRWLHSLSPSIKKTAWTPEEDKLLVGLYETHGAKWSVIARKIPGRTDDACSKRYREALDPSLKKDEWTREEDDMLIDAHNRLGGKWGEVGRELNRSSLACRNRWRMLERKRAAASRGSAAQQPAPVVFQDVVPAGLPITSDVTTIPWAVALPSMPMMNPDHYWDNHSADYSRLIQAGTVAQPAPFLQTHYSPLSEPPQELQSAAPTPPPFQFTSSSLSSALSIPSRSPVPARNGLSSELVSPVLPQPIPLSSHADNQDLISTDSPIYNATSDHMDTSVDPSGHDINASDEAEQSQDRAAGGALSPTQTSEHSPLTHFVSISPSLSRSSSSYAVGTAREDHNMVVSPTMMAGSFHGTPVEKPTELPVQSLSQLSPVDAVGTSREDTDLPSSPLTSGVYYRTPEEKAERSTITRKRSDRDGSQPRLSSKLPAASNILAYACGHPRCWPANAPESQHCFLTSQQLSDHWKVDHTTDDIGPNSFKCSLPGCGKGWKSINGLQYHLQISKAHFQRALANIPVPQVDPSPPSDGDDLMKGAKRRRKTYSCPHPQCRNQYKQLSGLRYHLSHGHSQELPAQLDSVPPALAQKFAQKLQKHANIPHTD